MAPGQRTVKSGGRPGAKWQRRGYAITNVCLPGLPAGDRNRQPKRAKRPHSKFSDRKALDGPAMRPATPLAVENGVGKLAANARRMPAWERERGELPTPICPCLTARSGRGFLLSGNHFVSILSEDACGEEAWALLMRAKCPPNSTISLTFFRDSADPLGQMVAAKSLPFPLGFRDPLNKDRRFIPLRLDDAPVKGSLAQFRYIDWLPADRERAYPKLLESCRSPDKPVYATLREWLCGFMRVEKWRPPA